MSNPGEMKVKLIEIGTSVGVVLPPELLAALNLKQGDELCCRASEIAITLVSSDREFDHQMAVARKIMARDRGVLSKLAKL